MKWTWGIVVTFLSFSPYALSSGFLIPTPEGPALWSECFRHTEAPSTRVAWNRWRSSLRWVQARIRRARSHFPELTPYLDEAEARFPHLKIICHERRPDIALAYGVLPRLTEDFPRIDLPQLGIGALDLLTPRRPLFLRSHFIISIPPGDWRIHSQRHSGDLLLDEVTYRPALNRLLHELLHFTSLNTAEGSQHKELENTPVDWDHPCQASAMNDRITFVTALIAGGGLHGLMRRTFPYPQLFLQFQLGSGCGLEETCIDTMTHTADLLYFPSQGLPPNEALRFCSRLVWK